MRTSGVAATFWAEGQVRAKGGRSRQEADLTATGEKDRRRAKMITLFIIYITAASLLNR